jgi:hypothetical protein
MESDGGYELGYPIQYLTPSMRTKLKVHHATF